MQVLWWLVPPLVATVVAMLWAAWAGRVRDDVRRDDSDEALERMRAALARSRPAKIAHVSQAQTETSHGVALRSARPVQPATSRRR